MMSFIFSPWHLHSLINPDEYIGGGDGYQCCFLNEIVIQLNANGLQWTECAIDGSFVSVRE